MKKTIYILSIIMTSCTVIKKPSHYPKSMIIDTKIHDSVYHYLDGNYDFYTKSKRFKEGEKICFKKFGKKYLRVKKCK